MQKKKTAKILPICTTAAMFATVVVYQRVIYV